MISPEATQAAKQAADFLAAAVMKSLRFLIQSMVRADSLLLSNERRRNYSNDEQHSTGARAPNS